MATLATVSTEVGANLRRSVPAVGTVADSVSSSSVSGTIQPYLQPHPDAPLLGSIFKLALVI